MSPRRTALLTIASIGAAAIIAGLAVAATQPSAIGDLGNNEGLLVDIKTFKIMKGKAKHDPSAQLVKMGAREVEAGAVVFRSGDKLYIADGVPAGGPQAMNPGDPMPTTIDGFNRLFENF